MKESTLLQLKFKNTKRGLRKGVRAFFDNSRTAGSEKIPGTGCMPVALSELKRAPTPFPADPFSRSLMTPSSFFSHSDPRCIAGSFGETGLTNVGRNTRG